MSSIEEVFQHYLIDHDWESNDGEIPVAILQEIFESDIDWDDPIIRNVLMKSKNKHKRLRKSWTLVKDYSKTN
jgi:hypothetical protein